MTETPAIAVIPAAQVAASLAYDRLIPALRSAFAAGAHVPRRHHHAIQPEGAPEATLLLMPAWQTGGFLGIKIVGVFPGNNNHGLPALSSSYLLCDATTGQHLALLDGNTITGRRTVATSALAADLLARPDASRLLVVGAGRIASEIPAAMRAVRPIDRVEVWSPRATSAADLVARLIDAGFNARVALDLPSAVGTADIISCATLATEPLIHGEWLRPGSHLDLIGSFTPQMREADDEAIIRSNVFIDDRAGLAESGDLLLALKSGALASADACTTLAALCQGTHAGRADPAEITLFKAVGTALADLAAACLVHHDHVAGAAQQLRM